MKSCGNHRRTSGLFVGDDSLLVTNELSCIAAKGSVGGTLKIAEDFVADLESFCTLPN